MEVLFTLMGDDGAVAGCRGEQVHGPSNEGVGSKRLESEFAATSCQCIWPRR